MRVKYHLPILTREQRMLMEYILHGEVEKQTWFAVVFLELWKTEGFICTQ